MATPARRDFAALEARRFQAARLFARGTSQGAVARALGVTPVTAHHWYHAWHAHGRAALKSAGRAAAGRPAYVGPARRNADPDPPRWELEAAVDRRGPGVSLGRPSDPLLLPNARGQLHGRCPHSVSARPQAPLPPAARAAHLGRLERPYEPCDDRLLGPATRVAHGGAAARLCA